MALLDTVDQSVKIDFDNDPKYAEMDYMERFILENWDDIHTDSPTFTRESHPEVFEILDMYVRLSDYEKASLKDMMEYQDRPTKVVRLDPNDEEDLWHIVLYDRVAANPEEYEEYLEHNEDPREYIIKQGKDYYRTNLIDDTTVLTDYEALYRLPTIEEGFNEWIKFKENVEKVKHGTIKYYRGGFNYLKKFFDTNKKVSEITSKDFKNISYYFPLLPANIVKHSRFDDMNIKTVIEIAEKEGLDRLSNKTINNHLINYKNMFDYFVDREYISENPVKVKLLKEMESEKTAFEPQDLKALFEGIVEQEIKDFISIALYSGMRLGEIVNMKKEHIYDDMFHIYDGKTKNASRTVYIHSKIKPIVEHYLKNNEGDYLIFDGRKDPIQKRVNRRIQPIIQDPNKTFHSCRKCFTRELLKIQPRQLEYIQMILGHQISEGTKLTTQTYGREMTVPKNIMIEYVESVRYDF